MFQSSKDFKPLNNNILVKPTTTASDDEVSDLKDEGSDLEDES